MNELTLPEKLPQQNWYKAIDKRVSRRRYYDTPLSRQELKELKDDIALLERHLSFSRIVLNQEGFSQAVKTLLGSYGLVTGASSFAAIVADTQADSFRANVEAGMLGEALILAATARGWNTCWIGGLLEKSEIRERLELGEEEEVLAITPLGRALDDPTLTEKVFKKVIGSRSRKPLEDLVEKYQPESYPDWVNTALESARLAPSAANQQPWRFEVYPDAGKLILRADRKNDRNSVSLYLDCGIALLHLLLGAEISLRRQRSDWNDEDADLKASRKEKRPSYLLLEPPAVAEIFLSPGK